MRCFITEWCVRLPFANIILSSIWVAGMLVSPAHGQASNPIVLENQQPGTSQWQIPFSAVGSDAIGQIKGYASAVSINKGENITFFVSVNPAQTYTIDVYRLGWYQGLGARLMEHIGPLAGVPQATCPTDPTTGMIECHWSPADTLATQISWTSGIYLAKLTNSQNFQNYIVFAVRDDGRSAALLYQQPVTTYQAYNDYPFDGRTGKSLYAFNSYGAKTVSGAANAVKVSFDRPYSWDGTGRAYANNVLSLDNAMIRWLEMSGYDVTYTTDIDTHTNGSSLLNYRGVLSVGHDEYWSKPMYDAFIAARDAGVNLGFFGADPVAWAVRFEASSTQQNRVLVCYRDANLDPVTDPSLKTVDWSTPPLNRPEQALIGVQYAASVPHHQFADGTEGWASYVVTNSGNWVYAGTGFKDGDTVASMVGYEADRVYSEFSLPNAVPGTYTLLSQSPLGNGGVSDYANSSIYQAPSGAWVFAAGTIFWSWALDNYNQDNWVDPRIQRTTANILDRFVNPAVNFSVAASPPSQTVTQGGSTSYNITISPTGGFTGSVSLSVSGLPSGANGSFAPNPATTSSSLSVTTSTSTPPGTYTLTITGSSGTLTHFATVTFVVTVPPDFTLSGSPASQTVTQGGSTSYTVAISSMGGFTGPVSLSVSGLPSGANGSFVPNPATTSSSLSVTTIPSTAVGTYTLTITGVSGTLTHTTTVTFVVSAPLPPDFTLSGSPASQTVTQGGSTSYTVMISPTSGFAGSVNLSVSGLPSGANGSFAPNPATTSSSLSVTTSTSTPPGTYGLTITGVSGTLTHTAAVSLTVAVAGVTFDNKVSSGFQWGVTSVTTPSLVIGSGVNRAAMIMVTMSANNATNITASLGGVSGTLVAGTDSGTTATIRTLIFQVINPPSGSQTAKASWTTSMNVDVGVITVSGANQANPCINGTFTAANSASATTAVTITSNPGDLTASVGYTGNAWVTPFTNRTLKWGVDSAAAGGDIGPGTGTTTHTWTDQFGSQTHSVSGANFMSAGPNFSVAASPPSQTVTQGGSTSYNITISPTGGFTGSVSLSVSGLPSGANGSFAPNPATTSSSLSVTTSTSTPPGTYTLTITGSSGTLTHFATVTFVVTVPPDFTLSGSPASQTVTQGGSTSYTVAISSMGGFTGPVSLSVSGLPSGANGSFVPNPATTSSSLSVTTIPSTAVGTYTLTITGVSGTLTHTTTVTFVVSAPLPPDFTLSGSPASQTVTQGGSTSYTVMISPTSGFAGSVNLSVSGLPSGANGSFAPNPATTSSSLSVTTSTSTPPGTYGLTITGVSGTLTHTAAVSLTVAVAGVTFDNKVSSGFQWGVTSVTTPSLVIGSGVNRAAMIMVTMSANNATNITASLGGVSGTLVAGTDSGTTATIRTLIFQVINPPSGSQTAKASWTTSMNVDVGVITVSGANQANPCINGTFTAANSASATTAVTITSNPGDLTASVGYTGNAWVTPFTNRTLKWGVDSAAAGGDIGPGTGTTTHTWTDQFGSQTHSVSGANFMSGGS